MQIHKKSKSSYYDGVRIDLSNFTADEDIESILELFFLEKDKNVFKRETKKFANWEMAKYLLAKLIP